MNKVIWLLLVVFVGCGHNPFNLKESDFILHNGRPIFRPKEILPVRLYYSYATPRVLNAYTRAAEIINHEAGCQIFSVPEKVQRNPFVGVSLQCWNRVAENSFIGFNEPDEPLGVCISHFQKDHIIHYSEVHIPCYRPFFIEQQRVAVHELLNTLGLEHDTELGSVLYHRYAFVGDEFTKDIKNVLQNYFCGNVPEKDIVKRIR